METDECSYIGGVDRVTIVWRCVHKLFTSDCMLGHSVAPCIQNGTEMTFVTANYRLKSYQPMQQSPFSEVGNTDS